MTDVQRELLRRDILKRVMNALRYPIGRASIAHQAENGSFNIVICLADDTVSDANLRVQNAGGRATVVVPISDGLMTISWDCQPAHPEALFPSPWEPIHPDSEMGMLADLLKETRAINMRITAGELDLAAQGGELLAVPA